MPIIGFLNSATPAAYATRVVAFRGGLREVGYIEGQNVAIEYRWAEGHYDRLSELANDLIAHGVAVMVATGGGVSGIAAKRATATVPIVFISGGDPVKYGLVASLNRPGGNATGISVLSADLTAKRLEVLRELVPNAKAVGLLVNPKGQTSESQIKMTLSAVGAQFGLEVTVLNASTPAEIDRAFASLAERRVDALLLGSDPFFDDRRDQLTALAARLAIPAVFDTRSYTEAGGLASYGPDYAVAYREAGAYAGRILHGAKPADLPVMQSSKIELVINFKTAKTLGLTVPQSLLARADEVIE